MSRLSNVPNVEAPARSGDDDIVAQIMKSLNSQPPGWSEYFADPYVRMRIGTIISGHYTRAVAPAPASLGPSQ
jgi:hypothetical protein